MADEKDWRERINWTAILLQLREGRLVPFLGAGVSLATNGQSGLPGGAHLAGMLAEECGYPGNDRHDLLRVSQYYALSIDETTLRESVTAKLRLPEVQPTEVHRILASWPVEYVLTTNFDNFMERAFSMNGKDPDKRIYNRFGDQEQIDLEPKDATPLVFKLHGSIEKPDSIILTEDNYIDFLVHLIEGNPKIPDKIKNIFDRYSILFLGYGLKDWNIRVLLQYLRKTDRRSYAIQRAFDTSDIGVREWENAVLYWERKQITVYDCDAAQFLQELDKRYKGEESGG